jgi:hypothetical protein
MKERQFTCAYKEVLAIKMQASVPQQSLRKDGMAFLTAFQHQLCMRFHTTTRVRVKVCLKDGESLFS